MRQCKALYAQYQAIFRQLHEAAKAKGDEAWDVAVSQGSAAAQPLYDEASRIRDEASEVLSKGSRARTRCKEQVYAHKSGQREKERVERERKRRARAAERLQERAQDLAMKGLGSFMPKPVQDMFEFRGKIDSVRNTAGAAQMLVNGSSYFDRVDALGSLGREASGSVGLPPISAMITNVAVTLLTDIHKSGMRDLKRGLSRFDQSRIDQLATRYHAKRNQLLQGGGAPVGSSSGFAEINQQISSLLESLSSSIERRRAARGEAYQAYVANRNAARQKRAAENKRTTHDSNQSDEARTEGRNTIPPLPEGCPINGYDSSVEMNMQEIGIYERFCQAFDNKNLRSCQTFYANYNKCKQWILKYSG